MNLKQLEAFVQVAEDQSFSKAAKELYLTQPTVSTHISALERELNARLFVRNTKEVRLSQDGQVLYRYAKEMIELERTIEREFATNAKEEKKCIVIAASTVPAQYILPGILTVFNERYPNEQFKLIELDSAQVAEKIASHEADVGFTGTVLEKKHCQYIPFYKDELIFVMPNNETYRKIQAESVDLEWLKTVPIVMREEGSGTRKESERLLLSHGIAPDDLNVVASIGNQEAIKRSVAGGMGVSIMSALAVKEEISQGKVLGCSMPCGGEGRDLQLVYNKNYRQSLSAERFIRVVKEMYGLKKKMQ